MLPQGFENTVALGAIGTMLPLGWASIAGWASRRTKRRTARAASASITNPKCINQPLTANRPIASSVAELILAFSRMPLTNGGVRASRKT